MKRGLRNAALTTARREEPSDVVGGGTIDVERLECEREREQEHTGRMPGRDLGFEPTKLGEPECVGLGEKKEKEDEENRWPCDQYQG